MEYVLYILLSLSVHSHGYIKYYEPYVHNTEAQCELKRAEMADFFKSDSMIGSTTICVKVVASPKFI